MHHSRATNTSRSRAQGCQPNQLRRYLLRGPLPRCTQVVQQDLHRLPHYLSRTKKQTTSQWQSWGRPLPHCQGQSWGRPPPQRPGPPFHHLQKGLSPSTSLNRWSLHYHHQRNGRLHHQTAARSPRLATTTWQQKPLQERFIRMWIHQLRLQWKPRRWTRQWTRLHHRILRHHHQWR